MPTLLRVQCNFIMQEYAKIIGLRGARILDIGIAGDEKPSGNYKFFGNGNDWKTMDCDKVYKPDIVADITKSGLKTNSFDLVILSNTLEHIFDFKKAIKEVIRITKSYFIIDCPFVYHYHGFCDETNFDDYWRISATALARLVEEAGGKVIKKNQTDIFTSVLGEKK